MTFKLVMHISWIAPDNLTGKDESESNPTSIGILYE